MRCISSISRISSGFGRKLSFLTGRVWRKKSFVGGFSESRVRRRKRIEFVGGA